MRFKTSIVAGALLLGITPAFAASEGKGAADLLKAIEGRVPGEPVDCINQRDIRSTRIISKTAILYETIGGTLYVNRPPIGQNFLDKWDVLVTDTHSHRLCSVDIVYLYDSSPWMQTGSIGLGEFVPYTKPRD